MNHRATSYDNGVPTPRIRRPSLDLDTLAQSWHVELTAANKSPSTRRVYQSSVRRYLQWCAEHDHTPAIDRGLVAAWIADMLADGAKPTTAAARLAGVRQFSKWLAAEGEIGADPLLRLTAPKSDVPITPVLTDDELRLLIKACQGKDLRDRRDEAAIRLMCETGMRAGECIALQVDDVDMVRGLATIVRGKGGRGRIVPFGPATARALDRYIRVRRTHPYAEHSTALWLGQRGTGALGYHGLRVALRERAELAGINDFHPHILRHTFCSRWLSARGSEGALMALAGWRDRAMLDRYARVTAADRAVAEARNLGLGDW